MILSLMKLNAPLNQLASDAVASSSGAAARCAAANFRWEQAVSDARADEYNRYVGDVSKHEDWKAEHKGYVGSFVHVAKDLPRSAESFMAVNGQAHLDEQLSNAYLLRLESIGHLLSHPLVSEIAKNFWLRFFPYPKDLRKDKLSDDIEALRTDFVAQWDKQRIQARPMFATFLNNFEEGLNELVKSDWPHILRDRLGLTHWPSRFWLP